MKCTEVKENLDALLDGEIADSSASEIENHLKICAVCETEYENLRNLGAIRRQNLRMSAPDSLDAKVFSAFRDFQTEKRAAQFTKVRAAKIGWFGVPRFAFAAAFLLFALGIGAAFQFGRMSAAENLNVALENKNEKIKVNSNESATDISEKRETFPVQSPVEPTVVEKIIKVPIVQEKIVTRIVYRDRVVGKNKVDEQPSATPPIGSNDRLAIKSRLTDNQYSTQIHLEGFQIVSDLKPQIIKGENNEK